MKRIISFGLCWLLLCQALGYVLVFLSLRWQEQHDLSERLQVYRSVDSLVEFQIPLHGKPHEVDLASATTEGFSYRGHYFSVVSMEVHGDVLHIAGLETNNRSFWQSDLVTFLHDHLTKPDDAHRKAGQWLKFLLKEYSLTSRLALHFPQANWRDAVHIAEHTFMVPLRALPVHSPPPELLVAYP